jgi:hypothetical protein
MRSKGSVMEADHPEGTLTSSGSEAARIDMTNASVLALLRERFAGVDALYVCPHIPGKKELAARAVHAHHLPTDERVLALFDDALFGLGDEGFLVTSRRLCWRNPRGRAQMSEWRHVDPDHMYADRGKLVLGGATIELPCDESVVAATEAAFYVLAFSAREPATAETPSGVVLTDGVSQEPASATQRPQPADASDRPTLGPSRATSAPPSAPALPHDSYVGDMSSPQRASFSCWRCNTPLHASAPHCPRCSAWPTVEGWRPPS